MNIRRAGVRITLRDRIAPHWLLGGFLLVGGLVAVAMPLGLANNAGDLEPWQRLASLVVGVGGTAAAAWWLVRTPATTVELDLTHRRMRVIRLGLGGRQVLYYAIDELDRAEAEQGSDNDGGIVWRPVLHLRNGERVLLSALWSHDAASVREAVAVVAELLG